MEKSNLINNVRKGFYTALTAGFLGLGAIYGCKDSPTGPPTEPNPPTIELSVSPPSGISPLETYVLGKCEDSDNDIADYRVMKGNDILTRTNPTDTTITLGTGNYSFYSKCGDKKGNEVTSDTSYVEVTRPPEPEKSLSQTVDLVNYEDINYGLILLNVDSAKREIFHDSNLVSIDTISTTPYTQTLEEMLPGNWRFIGTPITPNAKPDTVSLDVPDYESEAPDLSELDLDVDEGGSLVVYLKRATDKNTSQNPVHYTGVVSSGVEASLGTLLDSIGTPLNDTVLTIRAPKIPGPDHFPYLIGLMREGSLDTINLEGRVLDIPGLAPDQLAVASGGCINVIGDPTMQPCGDSEIFIMDEDGKNPRRLTYNDMAIDGTFSQDTDPNWSPDGSRIIYTSYRPDDEGGVAIWEVDLNGNERRLFGSLEAGLREVSDSTSWWSTGIVRSPAYSPDGTKIAFTYLFLKENSDGDRHGIAIWNGGNSFDFLTSDPCPRCFTGGSPSWSPDGSRIVFDRTDRTDRIDYEDGIPDIWMMNSDGSGKEKIRSNGLWPDWSPDGLYIAFASSPTGDDFYEPKYIYTLNLSNGSTTQITDNPDARDATPDWSPDGSKIVFLRGNRCIRIPLSCEGGPRMKVINLNTGEITQPIKQPPMSWQPGEYLIWPRTTEGFAWRPRQ